MTPEMTEQEFEAYLQSTTAEYAHNPMPVPPDVFRSLLILLDYVASDEEAHLAGMQANNEDTHEHICFEIRNLARWARQQKQ
jgi:hypothetical protein